MKELGVELKGELIVASPMLGSARSDPAFLANSSTILFTNFQREVRSSETVGCGAERRTDLRQPNAVVREH